jgi:hypothetical protein
MATEEQGKTLFVENLNPYVSEARVQVPHPAVAGSDAHARAPRAPCVCSISRLLWSCVCPGHAKWRKGGRAPARGSGVTLRVVDRAFAGQTESHDSLSRCHCLWLLLAACLAPYRPQTRDKDSLILLYTAAYPAHLTRRALSQDIFREFGQVSNVRLLRDKGLNAGAAYVTYKDRASAQQALQASNGQEICGKARHAVPVRLCAPLRALYCQQCRWAASAGLPAAHGVPALHAHLLQLDKSQACRFAEQSSMAGLQSHWTHAAAWYLMSC